MKQLETIQKTFRVFQILAKIAMIFAIVGAVCCAVGALCVAVWYSGGRVFGLFGELITVPSGGAGLNQALAVLLSDLVMLLTDATLLAYAYGYLKAEQVEGTPFTVKGADRIQKLGIRCIVMPIVATVIACVIVVCLGAEDTGDISNLPSVATGIVLILAAMIFRYGAVLEEKNKC
ncbi:MAG: hypothetical protein ACI3WQ_10795 [Faecousia sp.]